jgi:drug/metabolite transporter (DMT)-like permease
MIQNHKSPVNRRVVGGRALSACRRLRADDTIRASGRLKASHNDLAVGAGLSGVALFLLSLLVAALHMGASKHLTAHVSVPLIVWGRYVVFLLLTFPFAVHRHFGSVLRPPALRLLLARGVLVTSGNLLFIIAVAGAPLADMTAILFVYPFLMTSMAGLILGEKKSTRNLVAICAGFLGVLVVLRPSLSTASWRGMLALLAGASFGCQLLVTRLATRTAPTLVTASFTALVGTVVLTTVLPFYWQTPSWAEALEIAAIGALAALSQSFMIVACAKVDMSTLAPYAFSEIVFAILVGYAFFGEVPDPIALLGIAIILTSGISVAVSMRTQALRQTSELRNG